jgi:hypothetical protein
MNRGCGSEYVFDNVEQSDRIARLVLKRDFGETIERTESVKHRAGIVA